MEYYWDLKLKDGTSIQIAPSKAEIVKTQMKSRGTISTQQREILFSEIESFMMSSNRYMPEQNALSAVAQAFNEPIMTEDGIKSAWVKKDVTRTNYDKHYSKVESYKTLNQGSMVTIAFRMPIHLIDTNKLDYCNEYEVRSLEK